jgi:hypothetical protein
MTSQFISPGFKRRAREADSAFKERIPPGQYETKDFPVLSAGPTPRTPLDQWKFSIYGEIAEDLKWTWDEFLRLPRETVTVDIHCVTKWSKLDTVWTGVSVDTLLKEVNLEAQSGIGYLIAFCDGRVYHESTAPRRPWWKSVDCLRIRWQADHARAWRPGALAGPASLLLEKRQMGTRLKTSRTKQSRVLGVAWLSRLRGPLEGAAIRWGLNAWRRDSSNGNSRRWSKSARKRRR